MSAATSPSGFRRGLALTGFGSVANLGFLFLETIVVARLLPADVYGSYVVLLATVNVLVMAIDCGCKAAVTQLIASGDRARQETLASSAVVFRLAVVAGAAALLWLFQGLPAVLDPSPALAKYVGYLPLMVAAASLEELLFAMLQGFHAYGRMMAVQIARGVLRLALTLVLLVVFDAGIAALVYSWVVSFALAAAYQYWAMPVRWAWGWRWGERKKWGRGGTEHKDWGRGGVEHKDWEWRWALVRELLRFGLPLQGTRLLSFVSARLHVAFLAAFAGPAGVAVFAVAARIPDALQMLCDSFFRVYFPTMTTLLAGGGRPAARTMLERSLRLVSFGGALAAVVGTVFSREIIVVLFSAKYADSAPVFALLMLALHMTVVLNVMGYTLTAAGRPGGSLGVDVVRTAVSAGGDLVLVPVLGVLGSAYATVMASYASTPVAAWLLRRSELAAAVAPYAKQTLILLLCAVLAWRVEAAHPVYKVAIIALFVGLSLLASTISRADALLLVGGRSRGLAPLAEPLAAPLRPATGDTR
jgi:O-antigen/teichoic acid export membrane protein